MTGFEAYVMFLAMKRHFTSEYDYHKYRGKVNVRVQTYEGLGKQVFLFEKLSRHRDPERLLVSVISNNSKAWVGDLFTQEAEDRYNDFVRVTESLTYCLKRDLGQFDPWLSFDDLFKFTDRYGYPPVLDARLDNRFLVEVLCVIDAMVGGSIIRHWAKHSWDPVVKFEVDHVRKLQSFVPYDESLKETVKKCFINQQEKPPQA